MQISGEWYLCDDGIERPIIRGRARAADGSWGQTPFLLDTGADQTVLSADISTALGLPSIESSDRLGGLGGLIRPRSVETSIQLFQVQGGPVTFRSRYAAVPDLESLDMSVLGRDITGLFAVIVDRPGNVVVLIGQRHRYQILVTSP